MQYILPVCPPLSDIIWCKTRCTVKAASSTLRPKALPRTSRSRCMCFHKHSATCSGSHGGVISWEVAFGENGTKKPAIQVTVQLMPWREVNLRISKHHACFQESYLVIWKTFLQLLMQTRHNKWCKYSVSKIIWGYIENALTSRWDLLWAKSTNFAHVLQYFIDEIVFGNERGFYIE